MHSTRAEKDKTLIEEFSTQVVEVEKLCERKPHFPKLAAATVVLSGFIFHLPVFLLSAGVIERLAGTVKLALGNPEPFSSSNHDRSRYVRGMSAL